MSSNNVSPNQKQYYTSFNESHSTIIAHEASNVEKTYIKESNYIEKWDELKKILEIERNKGKKIVFTNGAFDIVHCGHLHCLKEAKKLGDILVIGINSDDSIKRYKGKDRPIKPLYERANVLAALRYVDYVTVFEQDTPKELIEFLAPNINVLIKGVDYINKPVAGAESVIKHGGSIIAIGWNNNNSTTTFAEKIKSSKK